MPNSDNNYTRGGGLLEPLLARYRANMANSLIADHLRQGRILDIGCGSYPYFLSHTAFNEKYAIDQQDPASGIDQIHWHTLNLNSAPSLPFKDRFFSVVTMLAVIEHLDPIILTKLFRESHRVLKPGGNLILTTPAAWSNGLLQRMASLGLVSKEEIDEHQFSYTLPLIGWCFGRAGFSIHNLKFGYFELFLNLWAVAERQVSEDHEVAELA
jgi:SAM-dependent methyltransferase